MADLILAFRKTLKDMFRTVRGCQITWYEEHQDLDLENNWKMAWE